MQFQVIVVTVPPTHTHPQTGPITIHAPQCNYNRQQQQYVTVNHLQMSSPHANTNDMKHLIRTQTNAEVNYTKTLKLITRATTVHKHLYTSEMRGYCF